MDGRKKWIESAALAVILAAGCRRATPDPIVSGDSPQQETLVAKQQEARDSAYVGNETERKFADAGLVHVETVDATIVVELVNSDAAKNYFRTNFYDGLSKAYLRKEVALKLSAAQGYLKAMLPDHSIVIMDAARPRSVSQLMYDQMKGTKFERYVADPRKGSMHNYGVAVDVTIEDGAGKRVDMGFTPFYKSDAALMLSFARQQRMGLSQVQKDNRSLLAAVMQKAGFIPLSHEWWHFNGMAKDEARDTYQIIE